MTSRITITDELNPGLEVSLIGTLSEAVAWAHITSSVKFPRGTKIKGDVIHLPDGTRFKIIPVLPEPPPAKDD